MSAPNQMLTVASHGVRRENLAPYSYIVENPTSHS